MSWCRDQKAALSSVAITAEGSALHAFGVLVIRLSMFNVHGFVGCPKFCVSQAPVCARGLSRYSGTDEVLLSSWTPSLSGRVVVRLRERRLWWFGWSPQFFGLTYVVELQLDLTSVTARLRGRVLNAAAVGVAFWLPLFWVDVCMCAACRTLGWPADVRNGKATP
ncbi:hypothetical protein Taro_026657 [Colocasia esculenta]|uniref:Uncharacterized protein n=1 Tax=Colocasia esculenta TaxID=4460 RepID=A0A843VCG5_COLES|nr:hypothetical protein [Colocasia esculenta]